jgi:hypothetical protein
LSDSNNIELLIKFGYGFGRRSSISAPAASRKPLYAMLREGFTKLNDMKYMIIFIIILGIFGCNSQTSNNRSTQAQLDSLQKRLENTYKPGFGDLMSSIQTHHAKLWFAGQNQNWKLADFEIHEINESLADIKEYSSDRPETKSIGMIDLAIDKMNKAIQQKSASQFTSSYTLLTNTCNSCHQQTDHEFIVIKIPDTPPFSNQDFKVKQ